MKQAIFLLASFLLLISTLACSLTNTIISPTLPAAAGEYETAVNEASSQPQSASDEVVLYFTIGMHIEPMGATAQGHSGGGRGDYHSPEFFEQHVQYIRTIAQIVEAHGGRMTIQAQSPFTTVASETGNPILADLAAHGHEIALHFHEDAHMGRNSETRSVQQWCDVMKEEMGYVTQASGVTEILYWSGGNLYPNLFEAAECAGLQVNSDWKSPQTQTTDLSLVGVNPWRPAGGTDGIDFTLFAAHDPQGAIIFLPEGQYDRNNFVSMRDDENEGGDEDYFEFLEQSLYASLAAAQPDKVNVFHFTVHPGEFRGDPQQPFAVIENFLTETIDPLVASGKVQWATFSEMAHAFEAWEAAHVGENPREVSSAPSEYTASPSPASSADVLGEQESQYTVTNPSSGAELAVFVFFPETWDGETSLPALVLVPGGNGNSRDFLGNRPGRSTVDVMNQAGYAVVTFDPDGRAQSGGHENYNGYIHQDGLAAVIDFVATLPGIDSTKIGLVTYSYGITMGAGTLARYPDLPVKFLIDWEGPANRDDTGGCDGEGLGHLQEVASCTDEAFWAEREASTFIAQIQVPYWRIQSEHDHVQPDNFHAILMVNNAVNGGVPWVRLNDLPPNQTYDPENPPAMLPDSTDRQQDLIIVDYAAELFEY